MAFITMASSLGLFLNEDDLDEANRLSKKIDYFQLAANEKDMIRNILEYNWDTENQMVSNLLHFPHIMPDDKRLKWLLKGLKEEKHPYYVLAAATGVAGLKLQGKDAEEIVELLKDISTSQPGMVALRAFMSLVDYLKHPKDTQFVLKFMHKSNSNLRYNSLDWLIENVKDKKELLSLLEDKAIPEDVKLEAIDRVNNSPESEVQDWTNEDLHHFTFVPNLAEFEAMRTKEQTLSELFSELDLDKDGLIGAAELRDFCEDIGQDITLERAAKDIALVDGDKDGKIDRDEWIELMFPKFNIQ